MTTKQLLTILQNNITEISSKLNQEEMNKFRNFIEDLQNTEDEDKVEDITDALLDFCMEYEFLKKKISQRFVSGSQRAIIMKPTAKETVPELANKLIQAIEDDKDKDEKK